MPSGKIVIVSGADHAEGRAVHEHLSPRRTIYIDDAWLAGARALEWLIEPESARSADRLRLGDSRIELQDVASVFFRPSHRRGADGRPMPLVLAPPADVEQRFFGFSAAEAENALLGLLLASPAQWINHPAAEAIANRKLHQLTIARRLGLRVPRTLISTEPQALIDFWHAMSGAVVTKAISNAPATLLDVALVTRKVAEPDLRALVRAPRGPVLFQQLIPADVDLRVTMVGDATFAIRIHSQEGGSPLDWRLDQSVRMEAHTLDSAVVERLQELRRALGLAYGAADLRITPSGEEVFLEINAQGSFLFVERLTGAPIAAEIARLLADPTRFDVDTDIEAADRRVTIDSVRMAP